MSDLVGNPKDPFSHEVHTVVSCSNITGSRVIKLFSCLSKLSMKLILLVIVKMLTIVGILTFISRIIDWF